MPKSPKPSPDGLSREQALTMAKAAEQAERYEEMVLYMKRIVELCENGDEMSNTHAVNKNGVEERNLISVGYKNMMSVRRTAWRTVQQFEDKESKTDGPNKDLIRDYKEVIAKEVYELIDEVINDIVNVFVDGPKKCTDTEVMVFFRKMEGDYNRYGAEITSGDTRQAYKDKALAAYKTAEKTASEALPPTNPIRLGLTLNFSVFYYEICEQKDEASKLAKDAFEDAIDHLDTLSEEAYKDSTLIMQLLKDNLTLWNENGGESDNDLQVEEVEEIS
jgi:14-3-3 protein epsilon